MEIKLTEAEARNVLVFLARVQLTGQEAPTLVRLASNIEIQLKPVVEEGKKDGTK